MRVQQLAGAWRALAATKDAPSLFDICDPLLGKGASGNAHLRTFYRTAIANPPLRMLLRKAGLPELRDPQTRGALAAALTQARDEAEPDWQAVAMPVADLVDTLAPRHPAPPPLVGGDAGPDAGAIDDIIGRCAAHLLRSFARNGYIPAYAAFNLIGDADMHGRDVVAALTGLRARGYKNSTLLFQLARVFIARSAAAALVNPPWKGIAEPMWHPMQVKHRSAYYDAFYIEALLSFAESGLARPEQRGEIDKAIRAMADFCLNVSRETVPDKDGHTVDVVTALAPDPHPRFSRFFAQIRQTLGFDIYVPDCDTTACAISAAVQAGVEHPLLDQPLIDFYGGYQVAPGENIPRVTVPLNDHIDYEGGIVTWIANLKGERPYGNDLDPTLNLDVLEASFRNHARWKIADVASRIETLRGIVRFHRRLVATGQFTDPKSHIYYLPELYCAYFGRCHAAFAAMPADLQRAVDPDDSFGFIREGVLGYVTGTLITHEMNPFDAALALMALGHLGAQRQHFAAPLACIAEALGEGGRHGPFRAYEWNKMKTPTRILVGGPEVTSAFVLMGLTLARRALAPQ
jgi:hypothetical protein